MAKYERTFRIELANRNTGEEKTITINALSREEAEEYSRQDKKYLVASIAEVGAKAPSTNKLAVAPISKPNTLPTPSVRSTIFRWIGTICFCLSIWLFISHYYLYSQFEHEIEESKLLSQYVATGSDVGSSTSANMSFTYDITTKLTPIVFQLVYGMIFLIAGILFTIASYVIKVTNYAEQLCKISA